MNLKRKRYREYLGKMGEDERAAYEKTCEFQMIQVQIAWIMLMKSLLDEFLKVYKKIRR